MAGGLYHDTVQRVLKAQLELQAESGDLPSETDIHWEKPVFEGRQSGSRSDVRLDLPNGDYRGYAFEVKARSTRYERLHAISQLADYHRAGYRPVLVARPDFYESEREVLHPGSHYVDYSRLLSSMGVSVLEAVFDNGVRFRPSTAGPVGLRRLFGRANISLESSEES